MTDQSNTIFCANHPNTETLLRCNRCEKPICVKCAVQTPTGYRCKECVRGQQKSFETAKTLDLPLAFIISVVLSFLGSWIARYMGFFTLFIAPIAGTIIAEAVRTVTQRRRSNTLNFLVGVGTAIGGTPLILWDVFVYAFSFGIIWQILYVVLVTSTAYYRSKGILLSR